LLCDTGLLLNQSLIQYGLAFLVGKSYSMLQPPYFMNKVSLPYLSLRYSTSSSSMYF
jgi:seryl-tRNA synthetase